MYLVYFNCIFIILTNSIANSRSPEEVHWDLTDKRFFGVLTEYVKPAIASKQNLDSDNLIAEEFKGKELLTFFVSSEHGIKEQDSYKLDADTEGLLGINVPHLEYIVRTTNDDINKSYQVSKKMIKQTKIDILFRSWNNQ